MPHTRDRLARPGLAASIPLCLVLLAACAPDDDLFGNASGAGGGIATSSTATSTPSGGGGSEPTSGSGGGQPACLAAADCPEPEGACVVAACVAGVCGSAPAAAGQEILEQTVGDCRVTVCDGSGGTEVVPDDDDRVDDGSPCTLEVCAGGELEVDFASEGTSCGDGELACDAEGQCVGCNVPDQCPGADGDCRARTCTASVCGFDDAPDGTVVANAPGDCLLTACDGSGNAVEIAADTDRPDDLDPCTEDLCVDGEPDHPPAEAGTLCQGGVCDGNGSCAGCVVDDDCGEDTPCADVHCDLDGVCRQTDAPAGTSFDPVAGDCLHDECDGDGVLEADLPDAQGAVCDGGGVCDGDGVCVGCNEDADCASGLCDAETCRACVDDGDCASGLCRCGICVDEVGLLFSEYVEGSLSNKAVEIWNASAAAVDLEAEGCAVVVYSNGSSSPSSTIALAGEVAAGEVHVLCALGTGFSQRCDATSINASWSGNDAVALVCDGVTLDVIGQIGFNPGAAWGSGDTSTTGATLRRRAGIAVGDPEGGDAFVPADQWVGYPSDTSSGLGATSCE